MSPAEVTGLIAILRGLRPEEAAEIGRVIHEAGVGIIEVPLNSPDPYRSIGLLRKALPDCTVGVGTVLSVAEVRRARDAGAQVIVSLNTNTDVIAETARCGLRGYPGAATPSEALTAIAAGARAVKVFPAVQVGSAGMKAWADIVPPGLELIPVGGIGTDDFPAWLAAGAAGFGIGSALFKPGASPAEVVVRARALQAAWQTAIAIPALRGRL